jgi:hypothetical protein
MPLLQVKRKTVLERMLAELDAQFNEEEEMLQEAEVCVPVVAT